MNIEYKTYYGIRHLLLLMAFVVLATACERDTFVMEQPVDPDTPQLVPDAITLTLYLSFEGEDGGATRVATDEEEDEVLRPGKNEENRINKVDVFLEPTLSDGTVSSNALKKRVSIPSWQGTGNPIKLSIATNDWPSSWGGVYNIYIGINLTDDQARAFAAAGNPEYSVLASYQNMKYGLTEAYAPAAGIGLDASSNYGGDDHGKYERKDIAMFCTESRKLILKSQQKVYTIETPFNLKRNVAKVLTTCKATNQDANGGVQGVDYCTLKGDLLYPADYADVNLQGKPRGWIRQKDVRFLVNALNLKSYIMEKRVEDLNLKKWVNIDPNYDKLASYFVIQPPNGIPTPQVDGNFYYNAVQTLNEQSAYYVQTLKYDANRIPQAVGNNSNSYYEGLYCPENTFTLEGVSDAERLILEEYNYPWPMITHVSITAKFTPRELYVEAEMADWIQNVPVADYPELTPGMREKISKLIEGGKEYLTVETDGKSRTIVIINTASEAESQAMLTASLRYYYKVQPGGIYNHKGEGFPENTYLSVVNRNGYTEFYTYGAARIIAEAAGWSETANPGVPNDEPDDPKVLASFKAMPRGRGYYYTYIDNRKESEPITPATYADSQVERNTYYILTINSFSGPGRTGAEPEYVKVHTDVVDWKPGGNAIVELE